MALVYRHIRLDKNEPFYIGIGKTERRAYFTYNRNRYWKNIVSKTEYRVDILFDDLTWDEAKEKEKEFIKLYGRIDLRTGTLCNMTDGGDGTISPTNEVREKISLANTGKIVSDKTREKRRLALTGRKLKPLTDEHKEKLRVAMTGKKLKPHTEATKEKLRLANQGKVHTHETREKMRLSHLGTKGKPLTQEHKNLLSSLRRKEQKPYFRNNPKSKKKWYVKFRRYTKTIYLGSFFTEQEAQDAIDKWKIENEKSLNTF